MKIHGIQESRDQVGVCTFSLRKATFVKQSIQVQARLTTVLQEEVDREAANALPSVVEKRGRKDDRQHPVQGVAPPTGMKVVWHLWGHCPVILGALDERPHGVHHRIKWHGHCFRHLRKDGAVQEDPQGQHCRDVPSIAHGMTSASVRLSRSDYLTQRLRPAIRVVVQSLSVSCEQREAVGTALSSLLALLPPEQVAALVVGEGEPLPISLKGLHGPLCLRIPSIRGVARPTGGEGGKAVTAIHGPPIRALKSWSMLARLSTVEPDRSRHGGLPGQRHGAALPADDIDVVNLLAWSIQVHPWRTDALGDHSLQNRLKSPVEAEAMHPPVVCTLNGDWQ